MINEMKDKLQNTIKGMYDSATSVMDNGTMGIHESKRWFEKQPIHEDYIRHVEGLKSYKRFKLSYLTTVLFGLVFAGIPIKLVINTFKSNVEYETSGGYSSILITTPFMLIGLYCIIRGLTDIKEELENTIPTRYVSKYVSREKSSGNNKSTTTYYAIVEINGIVLTIEVSRSAYFKLNYSSIVWIIARKRKHYLWGILDDDIYSEDEINTILSGHKQVKTPTNTKTKSKSTINIDDAIELDALGSSDWFNNNSLYDKLLVDQIQDDIQYQRSRESKFKNLIIGTGLSVIFSIITILSDISDYSNGVMSLSSLVMSLFFLLISWYLISETISFKNRDFEKIVQATLIDIILLQNNQSSVAYIGKFLVDDVIIQLKLSKEQYRQLKHNTPVWIYKYYGKTEPIEILIQGE